MADADSAGNDKNDLIDCGIFVRIFLEFVNRFLRNPFDVVLVLFVSIVTRCMPIAAYLSKLLINVYIDRI